MLVSLTPFTHTWKAPRSKPGLFVGTGFISPEITHFWTFTLQIFRRKISKTTVYAHLILCQEYGYYMFRLSKAAIIKQQQNLVKGIYIYIYIRYSLDAGMLNSFLLLGFAVAWSLLPLTAETCTNRVLEIK